MAASNSNACLVTVPSFDFWITPAGCAAKSNGTLVAGNASAHADQSLSGVLRERTSAGRRRPGIEGIVHMDDEKRLGRRRQVACAHKRYELGKVRSNWGPLEAVPVQMLDASQN